MASVLGLASLPASAQGLMSGTGLQPSQQLAMPPDTPAIDRPGAERTSQALHARRHTAQAHQPANTTPVDRRMGTTTPR